MNQKEYELLSERLDLIREKLEIMDERNKIQFDYLKDVYKNRMEYLIKLMEVCIESATISAGDAGVHKQDSVGEIGSS